MHNYSYRRMSTFSSQCIWRPTDFRFRGPEYCLVGDLTRVSYSLILLFISWRMELHGSVSLKCVSWLLWRKWCFQFHKPMIGLEQKVTLLHRQKINRGQNSLLCLCIGSLPQSFSLAATGATLCRLNFTAATVSKWFILVLFRSFSCRKDDGMSATVHRLIYNSKTNL